MDRIITYDRHARRRMRWRRISQEEVESVFRDPERLETTERGRMNAFRWVGNRYLRVTFRELESSILVISVVDRTD